MDNLLDRYANQATVIRPANVDELFSLRLAQKVGDVGAALHYLHLGESASREKLLSAYQRSVHGRDDTALPKRFHLELNKNDLNSPSSRQARLLSLRIERRAVAAAVFTGDHLEFTDARQLSSVHEKASASAVGFVNWLLQHFRVETAALEIIPNGHVFQRRALSETVSQVLRERGLPLWEVPKTDLLRAYGHPPVKSRLELRGIATTIWPVLSGSRVRVLVQDASILGLYVQIERLFIIN